MLIVVGTREESAITEKVLCPLVQRECKEGVLSEDERCLAWIPAHVEKTTTVKAGGLVKESRRVEAGCVVMEALYRLSGRAQGDNRGGPWGLWPGE